MIGVIVGLAAVMLTFVLKGVSPTILINMPSIMIVLVGTSGATIASVGLSQFKRFPKLLMLGLKGIKVDPVGMRDQLVGFAEKARRDGLLALESELDSVKDPFLRRGLQMVIDGVEPETVEEVLDLDTAGFKERHGRGANMFQQMAGYAPTFGILGAVMGLIATMAHLSDPEKLAAGIQVAFIATLMAVGLANILLMPVCVALRGRTDDELKVRGMAMTGVMSIQAGDNPRIVAQKLEAFLPPEARGKSRAKQPAAAAADVPEASKAAA